MVEEEEAKIRAIIEKQEQKKAELAGWYEEEKKKLRAEKPAEEKKAEEEKTGGEKATRVVKNAKTKESELERIRAEKGSQEKASTSAPHGKGYISEVLRQKAINQEEQAEDRLLAEQRTEERVKQLARQQLEGALAVMADKGGKRGQDAQKFILECLGMAEPEAGRGNEEELQVISEDEEKDESKGAFKEIS